MDEITQRLAFKPTLFGGNSLRGRDDSSHLECDVTMPIFNVPDPQLVDEAELRDDGDSLSVPFASTLVFGSAMEPQSAPGTTFKRHLAIAHGLNPNVVHKWLAGHNLKRMGTATPPTVPSIP